MKSLRRLLSDDTGSSIVELGLVGPILAAMVIGMIDLGKGFSEKLFIEQVAQRAVEKAMQGVQGDAQSDIFQTLKAEAATEAGVNQTDVVVKYWLECAGVSQFTTFPKMDEDYAKVCGVGVQYSRYLEVSIQKAYTPTFRMAWLGANSQGQVTLKAKAGIRVQ
jgi:Flp pilus assembly protein TadG